ncbi:7342_t:CDS:10, partial [Acaulospora colombiana]
RSTNDGTVIIRLAQKLPNSQCPESLVMMRYVRPNGSLVTNNVQFNFSSVNFCPIDRLEFHPLTENFNLLTYLEVVNSTPTTSNATTPPDISINAAGTFSLPIVSGFTLRLLDFTTFYTFDNNFAIAFSALSLGTTAPAAFVTFLFDINSDFVNPFPIYQPNFPLSLLEIDDCGEATFEGTGLQCIISGKKPGDSSTFQISSTFLTTGLILNLDPLTDVQNITNVTDARFDPLYFGGFLQRLFTNVGIEGQVYDSQGNFKSSWDIPLNLTVNSKVYANVSGFISPNIATTSSPNFSQVALETTSLTITFNKPVRPSKGNISIYQQNENNDLLRQTFSANSNFVTLDQNDTYMKVTVLESTFDQPSSNYYVVIDDDFVVTGATSEAVAGVPPRFWMLSTRDEHQRCAYRQEYSYLAFSRKYDEYELYKLIDICHSSFINQLLSQISLALPISPDRISSSSEFQFETRVTTDQLLLPITIAETRNTLERSATSMLRYLDVMIRNKWITALAVLDKWEGVDEDFGVDLISNGGVNYKYATLGIALSILAVLALCVLLISLPMALNTTFAVLLLMHEINENPFFYEYYQNYAFEFIIVSFSAIDVAFLELLDSKLGGWRIFGASYSKLATRNKVKIKTIKQSLDYGKNSSFKKIFT